MAQITETTRYADMAVGDVFPNGDEIVEVVSRVRPATWTQPPTELITVVVQQPRPDRKGNPILLKCGEEYPDRTYGEAVNHARFMRDTMPKYSD